MAILECVNLSKRFGKTQALEDVSLRIEPGRVVGLLGPNGSGKTTLIKLANGLLTPSEGEILIGGEPVDGPSREASIVFQDYALFPHMSVYENIARRWCPICPTGSICPIG